MPVTREQWEILYRYQVCRGHRVAPRGAWKALAEETARLYEGIT